MTKLIKGGKVIGKGWQQETDIDLLDHIEYFYDRGLKYVKSTDVDLDGMMQGPPFALYEEIMNRFPDIKVLASGGVRGLDDINRLADIGVFATIFGKVYYEGKLKLKELEAFTARANH